MVIALKYIMRFAFLVLCFENKTNDVKFLLKIILKYLNMNIDSERNNYIKFNQ